MRHKIIAAAAWATVGYIAFVTLSPIELRPHVAAVNYERFFAYFLAGILLAVAYPRRLISFTGFIVLVAVVLEMFQQLVPGRHAHLTDALTKASGGLAGIVVVTIILHLSSEDGGASS
jgi:VanZ family protein